MKFSCSAGQLAAGGFCLAAFSLVQWYVLNWQLGPEEALLLTALAELPALVDVPVLAELEELARCRHW